MLVFYKLYEMKETSFYYLKNAKFAKKAYSDIIYIIHTHSYNKHRHFYHMCTKDKHALYSRPSSPTHIISSSHAHTTASLQAHIIASSPDNTIAGHQIIPLLAR